MSEYNASFVGFLPSRKPALTILVVIDSPHGRGYYGGVVAGPVFKRIAEAALQHLGIAPTVNPAPPVLIARHDDRPAQLPVRTPASGMGSVPVIAGAGAMPDLHGLSARDALRTLARIGLAARISGSGFVADQTPPAGSPVEPGAACAVVLRRQPGTVPDNGGTP
jgi:hypothetical protein